MGLLRNLFSPLVSWWRMVWYTPERDMPPLPPEQPVSVINMPSAPVAPRVVEASLPKRIVEFRGMAWQEAAPADANGIVTFTREVAVNGRPVLSELRVREADLTARGDVYHLNGRD